MDAFDQAQQHLDAHLYRLAQARALMRSQKRGEQPDLDKDGKIIARPEEYELTEEEPHGGNWTKPAGGESTCLAEPGGLQV